MSKTRTDSPQPSDQPDFAFEQDLMADGKKWICGIDEAGRGPLAGPVVAAAVILDPTTIPDGLHDSKRLTERRREILYDQIVEHAWVSIASVSAATIDRINIRAASLLAMQMTTLALEKQPDHALIDGNALPNNLHCPATTIIKGDARSLSIAAASIIAKVTRDRLMIAMERHYPGYGLAQHKGYPTKAHRQALLELGPTRLHRLTFAPVKAAIK